MDLNETMSIAARIPTLPAEGTVEVRYIAELECGITVKAAVGSSIFRSLKIQDVDSAGAERLLDIGKYRKE